MLYIDRKIEKKYAQTRGELGKGLPCLCMCICYTMVMEQQYRW